MNRRKQSVVLAFLVLILLLSVIVSINLGSVDINIKTAAKIIINNIFHREIFYPDWDKSSEFILLNLRAPRIILACIIGGALSIAGILMQALTQNPLADPYLLGVSSGASLGAVLSISYGLFNFFGTASTSVGGFLGAITAMVLVFKIANIGGTYTSSKLILIGIAISAVFSSITTIILFFLGSEGQLRQAIFWMSGSLSGANLNELGLPFLCLLLVFTVSFLISTRLDAFMLGEEDATVIGVDTVITRNIILICATLLTGIAVSVSGVIGFLGLMIPHISRHFVGIKHRFLLPVSLLSGAIFLVWSDTISRIIFPEAELPIGVVTSFFGAAFFIWLMKNSSYRFGGKG